MLNIIKDWLLKLIGKNTKANFITVDYSEDEEDHLDILNVSKATA